MKSLLKIKPTTLNFISNFCAFLITYSISFFLSPYIVGVLGEDAYGFVSLAQNFTNYIALATVALNSLAGRFISIAVFEGNHEKARRYYTSVLIANAILTLILIIPCTIVVFNLEKILSIPTHLISDVKILFAMIFAGFFVSLFSSLFSVGVFVENKLYLTARVNVISAILRLITTLVLFLVFPAKIFFMGIVSLTVNLNSLCWQYFFKRKYLPGINAKMSLFDGGKIKELLKAGSWSLVGQLSGILNSGLDLLITNQFVSSEAMGVLAIASTLPTLIHAVLGSVSSSFTPDLTKDFAKKDYTKLMKDLKSSMNMMGIVLIVPLAGLTAFGFDFYKLWQPTQNAMTLQILSIFKILTLTFTARMAVLQEIFVVANKLKAQAIATLIQGVLHLICIYILLSTTNLGVYAIVCMGAVIGITRNFVFTFPYAAKCVKQKWNVFFWPALQAFISYTLITALFYAIRYFIFTPTTWLTFIVTCIICGALGFVLNMFIITSKESRKAFFDKIKGRFGKKKERNKMKKVDILFLYETRVRELENICLVKNELEKRGYTVGIQNTWNSLGIKKFPYKAKVVVTHGMYHDGIYYFAKSLVGEVPKIVNMQWEQIGTINEEKDDTSRFLLSGVAKQSMNICWGDQTYNRLKNRCGFDDKHLRKTGQITLDFCRPELKKYYLTNEEIRNKYKISHDLKLNLFISSFAYVNLPESIGKESDIEGKQDFIQFSRSSFNGVLEWFKQALEEFPSEAFVYRPHPAEANNPVLLEMQEKYKGRFFVISELSVKQWVAIADRVYSWYSTAAAEVYAFGVPFAILRPVKIPPHLEVSLYEKAEFITTYENFEETLKKSIKTSLSEEIFNHLYYRDEQFAFVKVADAIEEVLKDDFYLVNMPEQEVKKPPFIKALGYKILSFIKSCLPKKSKLLEKYRKPGFDEYTLKLRKNNYASEEDVKMIQEKLKNILDNK